MELRTTALSALCESDPRLQVQRVQSLWEKRSDCTVNPQQVLQTPDVPLPGRPAKPVLKPPQRVPSRSVHTAQGLAGLVHSICHIEFNAIHLALDAIWRFQGLPEVYYQNWLQVAYEESTHFAMLEALLNDMGFAYGDFDAHDGLWQMCEKTANDVIARMALVPRTLEARGLDATPLIQSKLVHSISSHAKALQPILDTILRDEVGHVAIGNRWYHWLCEQQQLDPLQHYPLLVERYAAPRLKPPFNLDARLQAGFTPKEIDWLLTQQLT